MLALTLGTAVLNPSSAHAGEWVQRSCSFANEPATTEGWEFRDNDGYDEPSEFEVRNGCFFYSMGGGLDTQADTTYGDLPGAGEEWTYKPPPDSAIAGGMLDFHLSAPKGEATIGAVAKGGSVTLARCETDLCYQTEKTMTIAGSGWTELYERAACDPTANDLCSTTGPTRAAEADITSAQIILATNATPTASGLSGTLLGETLSGKGTLSFTARDPGPGVYQARVLIDGQAVWAGSPSLGEGNCVSTGTYEGIRAFNYAQPCPAEAAVHAEVNTTSLADGAHHLTVEVEDAAGNVATVYSGTLTTANHPVSPIVLPPNRGALNGNPASESAILAVATNQPRTFTRPQARSAAMLSGRLIDPAGAPITGAQIQLTQQVVGAAAPNAVATTTTSSTGAWTLKVPKGPSRLLQVAYYSHLLDTVPAAALAFHERVTGTMSLHAPRWARLGRGVLFTGALAGGYVPAGGESVQMEILYGGRWRTIEVLPTTSRGRWAYKYVFTLGAGATYLFRAVTVPNGSYPFLAATSPPVRVRVR
jgi:hypothetical protein